MADLVPNIALGRGIELTRRAKDGDPSDARLYAIPCDVGAVTDEQLRDADTFADAVTAGVTERTSGGWNRKTIAAADIAAIAPDDTNNRHEADITIDLTWTTVSAGATTDVVICFASVASPTNSQLTPVAWLDFVTSPDGSDIVGQFNANGFYRAAP